MKNKFLTSRSFVAGLMFVFSLGIFGLIGLVVSVPYAHACSTGNGYTNPSPVAWPTSSGNTGTFSPSVADTNTVFTGFYVSGLQNLLDDCVGTCSDKFTYMALPTPSSWYVVNSSGTTVVSGTTFSGEQTLQTLVNGSCPIGGTNQDDSSPGYYQFSVSVNTSGWVNGNYLLYVDFGHLNINPDTIQSYPFTVTHAALPPTGTLLPATSSCVIALGASTCTVNYSWSTTNPNSGVTSQVTTAYPVSYTVVGNGNSGTNVPFTIPYSTSSNPLTNPITFYLYNTEQLKTATATATCDTTTSTWNGTICAPGGTSSPNLTAGVVTPTSATVNTATTFSSTISNTGSTSTGASFSNFFQVATATNGGGTVTDLPSTSMSALAAGGTNTATKSYTFSSTGTYSMRACADKTSSAGGGVITESNENDNCGSWVNITVLPLYGGSTPTVSISANPTSGIVGLNPALTWSATNSPSSCSASGAWSGTKAVTGSGVSQGAISTAGTYTYTLVCTNSNGASSPASATVSVGPAPSGACSNPMKHYYCAVGSPSTKVSSTSEWTWYCDNSANGGGVSGQCTQSKSAPKPIEN